MLPENLQESSLFSKGIGKIFSPAVLISIVILILLLHFLCLGRYPAIGGDAVFFSSTAYLFSEKGIFASPISDGADRHIIDFMPPVVTLFMSASFKLFGFGVRQTRFVSLACGVISAVVLFLLLRLITRDKRLRLLIIILFLTNAATFRSFQAGRFESTVIMFLILLLYLGFVSRDVLKKVIYRLWLSIGAVTGVMVLAYYPFAIGIVLTASLLVRFFIFDRSDLSSRQKLRLVYLALFGFIFVLGLFIPHVILNFDIFSKQFLTEEINLAYSPLAQGLNSLLNSAWNQLNLFWLYAFRRLELVDILLAIFVLTRLPAIVKKRRELSVFWLGFVLWIVMLTFYPRKGFDPLAYLTPFLALGIAIVSNEIHKGGATKKISIFFKRFVFIALFVGLFRMLLVYGTVIYQWKGRDYNLFDNYISRLIPEGSTVIGPQLVWYSLAKRNCKLRLYTQEPGTGHGKLWSGDLLLNDKNNLGSVDYIIFKEEYFYEQSLPGLRAYVAENFVLLEKLRMPFKPLPWIKISPLDVDIYVRKALLRS